MRMQGISERRGRRNWSRKRQNHTFNWDFRVDQQVVSHTTDANGNIISTTVDSSVPLTFTGNETHNNNEVAVKEVIVREGITRNISPITLRFVLYSVNQGTLNGGTSQTTQDLNPVFVSYGCQ